jgi:hypothetical protein
VHVTPVACPSDQVCSSNRCYYPSLGDCDLSAVPDQCLPGTTCTPRGGCTADPYNDCWDDSNCSNGGRCVSHHPPQYKCKPN